MQNLKLGCYKYQSYYCDAIIWPVLLEFTTHEACSVHGRIHKLVQIKRILLAPIDADFIVFDRLETVDGTEGESTIGRVPIRGIIRDDFAAGFLPEGYQSVMYGPVHFSHNAEDTLVAAGWQTDWHYRIFADTKDGEYAASCLCQLSACT